MKKELNIVGLDCGNCALTLEKYLQKIEGVKSLTINFSTSKIFLEVEDAQFKTVYKEIIKTAKVVNPDVKISIDKENTKNNVFIDIILYDIGIILGSIVIFFKLNVYAYYSLLVISLLLLGYRTYLKAIMQLKKFVINENTLITISIIGACALGETMEGIMVIALYTLGKMLESRAVNYSRNSISKLISTQPEYAVLYKNKVETQVKPETIKIGDLIIVKAGEKVSLDGIVYKGSASVDKKHLTGESIPVEIKKGDIVESGSIVLDSTIVIKVTAEYKDSAVSKILDMLATAQNQKSKTETFISKFSTYYTLGVIILSILVWGLTWAILGDISTAIYRGLIFLVISCPCAFAISVPLSYFGGIGRCSKQGILIKGSNYLDACAKLDEIIFDKTGTLTTGEFVVEAVESYTKLTNEDLLDIVVAGERNSLHPIAMAICKYHKSKKDIKISNYKEIAGKGIEFKIKSKKYSITRGAQAEGFTIAEIKEQNKLIGKILLTDTIKDNAKSTIAKIKELGIRTMMLTGDNNSVAVKVSSDLELDEYKSELMPEDKYKVIEEKKGANSNISFVGDGINDAPALTLSNVGISMGLMGSDATIESSDVVIADDNLAKIPALIQISKYTRKIVWQNIIFAGVTKLAFLALGALGITGMLLAVFADVGVTLLAILNSLRVIKYKTK